MKRSTTLDNSGALGTQDLHSHTNMSDGDLALERVVALAVERRVAIGISDHISSRNPDRFIATERGLRAYPEALDDVPVFRAGEFCWCDRFGEDLPSELLNRLDYRIGSNHGFALPDGVFASPWWVSLPKPWGSKPHRLMDVMVDNLCRMVRVMPIQIAAHPTLMPPALLDLEDDVHAWWTHEREDRFVEAAAMCGVALEISNRYRLPHDRLLKKAKQAGARFSLGSDGHGENQVARLDWSIATARRVGITDDDLFVAEFR